MKININLDERLLQRLLKHNAYDIISDIEAGDICFDEDLTEDEVNQVSSLTEHDVYTIFRLAYRPIKLKEKEKNAIVEAYNTGYTKAWSLALDWSSGDVQDYKFDEIMSSYFYKNHNVKDFDNGIFITIYEIFEGLGEINMKNFMTKEQFYDNYNVFEYGHKLGHQVMVVDKEDDMIRYIDEGESLEDLYNQLFFSFNVVDYVNYNERKHNNTIDLVNFYVENFEVWEPLADIYTDELIQWSYMGDEVVFKIFVQGKNKGEYRFYQEIKSAVLNRIRKYEDTLVDPSKQDLKNKVNEYLLRYMERKALQFELMSGKRN